MAMEAQKTRSVLLDIFKTLRKFSCSHAEVTRCEKQGDTFTVAIKFVLKVDGEEDEYSST